MKIIDEPKDFDLMHPVLKYVSEQDFSFSGNEDIVHNSKQEVRFRLGVLQKKSEDMKKTMLLMYKQGRTIYIFSMLGDDWDRKEIDMSVIPSGMESLFLVSYLENLIVEMNDPICDYDLCQYLCGEAEYDLIMPDIEENSEDIWV